ncbi:MAG: 30S ribosome-binding factor RbfA [Treponema sp.]|jgi:ribosome-binding factor A|nr:30S ribosome-binding factor RbfA [Treponema sp.]
MGTYRIERIERMVQEKIGALILEDKIKDPRVHPLLSVTRVRVSRDLAFADVYVSNIREHGNTGRAVAGLQSAAGFIQTELASFMRIRKIPRLRFHPDTGIREGFDLVKKIEQLTGGGAEDPAKDDERQ